MRVKCKFHCHRLFHWFCRHPRRMSQWQIFGLAKRSALPGICISFQMDRDSDLKGKQAVTLLEVQTDRALTQTHIPGHVVSLCCPSQLHASTHSIKTLVKFVVDRKNISILTGVPLVELSSWYKITPKFAHRNVDSDLRKPGCVRCDSVTAISRQAEHSPLLRALSLLFFILDPFSGDSCHTLRRKVGPPPMTTPTGSVRVRCVFHTGPTDFTRHCIEENLHSFWTQKYIWD